MSGGSSESETSEEMVTPIRLPSWSTVSTATLCGTNRIRPRRSSPSDIGPMIGASSAPPVALVVAVAPCDTRARLHERSVMSDQEAENRVAEQLSQAARGDYE